MQNEKFLRLFGYIFLVWGIFDIILKIYIYDFWEFDFMWFCSITLFILAFGLILKNDTLLNSFLSIALVVQIVFIMDYIWISFFNIKLNGTSAYIFQPGFGLLEFISTTKHLFMMPFAFYGIFLLSKKNIKSYLFIPVFIISLLTFSYLFSPKYKNLNCAFKPCFKFLFGGLSGFQYLIFFMITIIVLSLFINFLINFVLQKSEKVRNKKTYKKSILFIFIILLGISLTSVMAASFRYSNVPQYKCEDPDICINCIANIKCNYIDRFGKNLTLVYSIKNKDDKDYVCDVYMKISPKIIEYEKIGENFLIMSKRKYKIWEVISYPEVDSQIKLKLDCK